MDFNIQAYETTFLERQFKATSGKDFTLDVDGTVLAWNDLKGTQPSEAEVAAGVLKLIKQDIISRVNNLSGDVRNSYLSDGLFVVEEYRLAEVEALDYKARGFQAPVPTTITDYAQILGTTNYTFVANSILAASAQLKMILTLVRKVRLTATTGIGAATTGIGAATTGIGAATTIEQIVVLYNTAVASLEALRKPGA